MTVNISLEKEKVPFFKFNGNEKFIYPKKVSIPAVNIEETPEYYLLRVATPGFKREELEIVINNQILIISAIKQSNTFECVKDRCEYDYTNWSRPFILPDDAEAILAKAKYSDGELIIRIPKGPGDIIIKDLITVYIY